MDWWPVQGVSPAIRPMSAGTQGSLGQTQQPLQIRDLENEWMNEYTHWKTIAQKQIYGEEQ